MTLSLAQDAISLLIDLAERGEIDPWDVKVIDVIDRFLRELAPFNAKGREHYEANLSQSGQAFLYASMLVLLKAESLAQADAEPEQELPEDLDLPDLDYLVEPQLPLNLERQLRRRAVAPPPPRRRVTLKELIEQLQVIAATLEEKVPRARPRRPRPQSKNQAIRAIAQLAHQENLSEMAIELEQFLADYWTDSAQAQAWINFDLLIELWSQTKQQARNAAINDADEAALAAAEHARVHDRVGVFWALLLLSAQTKVELSQTEFYQDLRVRALIEKPETGQTDLPATAPD
ncbi:MAG: segregation/condensation protein A [Scytolyngbya sp. HA4215-MV1]|jgi:segregation and condensation protein A|nr:segregation/condensation protein A [Scytolyngbya sp. HA4215-MV1]